MEAFSAYMQKYDCDVLENCTYSVQGKHYVGRTLLRDGADCRVLVVEDHKGMLFLLKIARHQRRHMARIEYEMLSTLGGECFAHAVAMEEQGDCVYLLREYIPGQTLAAYAEGRKLPVKEACSWTLRVCEIIAQLHQMDPPIVHRDIKPQNFIVTPDHKLVLIDMDSCQRRDSHKNMDTQLFATVETAAPEQFGARRSDERSDIYGIGMLMLYLFTNDTNLNELPSCNAPRWLKRLIRQCTSFDPAQRPASLSALQRRLRLGRDRPLGYWVAGLAAAAVCAAVLLWPPVAQPGASGKPPQEGQTLFINVPLIELGLAEETHKLPGTLTREDIGGVRRLLFGGDALLDAWEKVQCLGQNKAYVKDGPDVIRDMKRGSIRYLDDLRQASQLEQLALYKQRITDIAPLANLPLTRLSLADNPISDFSALSTLTGLVHLDVCATEFGDVTPLLHCRQLQALHMMDTPPKDIAPLAALPIQELALGFPDLEGNETVLEGFPQLKRLTVSGLPAASVAPIGRLVQLEQLALPAYQGLSLRPLQGLGALQALDVSDGTLQSLEGAQGLVSLQSLVIRSTLVTDLSPLFQLQHLQELTIVDTPIAEYAQLWQLPALRRLYVNFQQMQALQSQNVDWPFSIVRSQ